MSEEDVEMDDSAVDEDDGPVFKVDEILGTRVKKNIRYYKVRWTDTWETEENLHECQEAIDAFWERTGGKDKAKPPIVVNTEDPPTGGKAYPLRQSKDEQSSKKKRKGTSKKIQRLKKRKLQGNESSSDEENGDESDNTDAAGGKSSLPSPQIGAKKVKRLKSKKMKNVNKDLFASEEGGATDDGDDGDDEDDSVPLKQLLAPASTTKTQGGANSMQAECPPKETLSSAVDDATGSALTSTDPVSQVPESSGIPDESQITNPNEASAAAQDEELAGAVPSAATEAVDSLSATTTTTTVSVTSSTAISTAASTGTTTTTTTTLRLRLGTGTKRDPQICSSASDDDEADENTPFAEVKVKEEPVSEEEEVELFKRSSKLKAQLILSRYNQTGGDANVDGDDYIPDIIRREEEDVINQHIHAELPPLPDTAEPRISHLPPFLPESYTSGGDLPRSHQQNVSPSSVSLSYAGLEPPPLSEPCISVEPVRIPSNMATPSTSSYTKKLRTSTRSRTSVSQSKFCTTPSTTSSATVHSNTSSSPRQIRSNSRNGATTTTVISTAMCSVASSHSNGVDGQVSTESDIFDYAVSNVSNAVPVECCVEIISVGREDIKRMVARVLHLLKQLIEHLKLPYGSVQEYMRALLMKSVVVAIRETYNGNNYSASFLEEQIHQFSQIILKELPFDKLAPLLTSYAEPYTTSSKVVASTGDLASPKDVLVPSTSVADLTPASLNTFAADEPPLRHSSSPANGTKTVPHLSALTSSSRVPRSGLHPLAQISDTVSLQKNDLDKNSSKIHRKSNSNKNNSNSEDSNSSNNRRSSFIGSNSSNNHDKNDSNTSNNQNSSTSSNQNNNNSNNNNNNNSRDKKDSCRDESGNTNTNHTKDSSITNSLGVNNASIKNNDKDIDVDKVNKLLKLKHSIKKHNTARKSADGKSPSDIEDVLGPHKFYRPPSKMKVRKTSTGLAGDSVLSGGTIDTNVRYKDRVNKIFAAKLAASKPAKVVLTLSDSDDDTGKNGNENEDCSDSSE